jgi:transposase
LKGEEGKGWPVDGESTESAKKWRDVKRLSGDGVSQREIARRLQINRRTVARMAASETPPQASRRRGSQLDPLRDAIAGALRAEPQIRAPRLAERLRVEHGYVGSVDLVRRRLAELRACEQRSADALGSAPGRLMEWGWVELQTRAGMRGAKRSVWALVAVLPFSGAQTAHFSLDATLESFLEAHVRALAWLEGVPQECRYHHLRPVAAKRDSRGSVRWSKRFRELRGHYGFRTSVYRTSVHPPAGSPARGGDPLAGTGHSLQSALAQLQRGFLPERGFARLGELDALYPAWRDALAHRHEHASADGTTVAERLLAERRALRALPPAHFDYSLRRVVRVGPDGYVRHGACFYRAPAGCANQRAELHASRDEIWLVVHGKRVAGYPRSYRPGRRLPQPLA